MNDKTVILTLSNVEAIALQIIQMGPTAFLNPDGGALEIQAIERILHQHWFPEAAMHPAVWSGQALQIGSHVTSLLTVVKGSILQLTSEARNRLGSPFRGDVV